MFQVFHDFGCLRTPFCLPFWFYFEKSSVWAFGKTAESVVKVVNFGGLAPARLILFTCPDCGCISMTFFEFFIIFSCLGAFILRAFGLNHCPKKGRLKTNTKKE